MSEKDINLDTINEVYRNASVALLSISKVVDEAFEPELKKEILSQYDGYEKFITEITCYMKENGYEIKDVGAIKKVMMTSGIKMNTMMDDSEEHIAQIMVKGTVMGITELCKILNNPTCSDKKILDFAERLKTLEEQYEERLKKFL